MGSQYHTTNPGATQTDGGLMPAFRASSVNGGVTVIAAQAVETGTGTHNIVLQNYGTSGTVAGGTIAGMSGGTAAVWAADVPQDLTITASNAFVDAGEWLVWKNVAGDGILTVDASLVIEYVAGVVTQG
jgi:hypothetical protein